MNRIFGFYSEKAVKQGSGTAWHLDLNGHEVEVTLVDQGDGSVPEFYKWDDTTVVAELKTVPVMPEKPEVTSICTRLGKKDYQPQEERYEHDSKK